MIVNDLSTDPPTDLLFSELLACVNGHGSLPEIEPRTFSFNTPKGACPDCQGLGFRLELDRDLIVPNPELSIGEGAIDANGWNAEDAEQLGRQHHPLGRRRPITSRWTSPGANSPASSRTCSCTARAGTRVRVRYVNTNGDAREYMTTFRRRAQQPCSAATAKPTSDYIRDKIEAFMAQVPCSTCGGKRLRPEALAVTVGGQAHQRSDRAAGQPAARLGDRPARRQRHARPALSERDQQIAHQILKEIEARVNFLNNVGLGYLDLARSSGTLSGGEAQRIRLATQIGSQLTGVLYVLDEPSIGLHQRDNAKLIHTLMELRDLGNTLLVVEHDEETMRMADWLIDLGPGAGEHGGCVVAEGTPEEVDAGRGQPDRARTFPGGCASTCRRSAGPATASR